MIDSYRSVIFVLISVYIYIYITYVIGDVNTYVGNIKPGEGLFKRTINRVIKNKKSRT